MNPLVMSIIEDKYIDEEEKLEIEHLSEFKEESLEILEQLEEKLVTLEHAELNDEIVKEVYRSFHSIKGIAGFASQTLIETIAHNTETILSKLQNGLIEFDLVVVEILINSVQLIKQLCKDFSLVKDKKFNEIVKIHLNNLKNFKIKEHKRLEILDDLVLENEEYIKVPLRKIEDLYFRIETIRRLSDKLDEYNYVQYKEELNIVLEKIENYISRYKAQEIETLFKKLHKVAKYNMKTTGINCEIICKGGEIVIDKKILNRLFVPMVQIVRNA
ncbi:MAG: Hpt domain-containing protein, partial [Fusobacteriaceae bacterium]|nr:Hpt domain-containing protein [Fusobacteriaceae bacterium]